MGKELHARKKLEVIEAYQAVFRSPNGEIVLKDLMKIHHVLSNTFNGDANQTIFKEGERNVVLRILSLLNMDAANLLERIEQYEKNVE